MWLISQSTYKTKNFLGFILPPGVHFQLLQCEFNRVMKNTFRKNDHYMTCEWLHADSGSFEEVDLSSNVRAYCRRWFWMGEPWTLRNPGRWLPQLIYSILVFAGFAYIFTNLYQMYNDPSDGFEIYFSHEDDDGNAIFKIKY